MHEQHREIRNSYGDTILHAKQDHWRDFLESSSYENLWIANKYISGPGSDGSKTRIPMLKLMATESVSSSPGEAATNGDKSEVLTRLMFPREPQVSHVPPQFAYSPSFPIWGEITPRQIGCHITRLSPYKATGTDDIPNIVLIQSADLLMPYLLQIYRVILELGVYMSRWTEIITCVLRNPRKPRYDILKAYRPIMLLNTMAKLLSSIIAEEISHLTEKYHLLPGMHFGSRPKCMTTDSLHLLTDMVKVAWR